MDRREMFRVAPAYFSQEMVELLEDYYPQGLSLRSAIGTVRGPASHHGDVMSNPCCPYCADATRIANEAIDTAQQMAKILAESRAQTETAIRMLKDALGMTKQLSKVIRHTQ